MKRTCGENLSPRKVCQPVGEGSTGCLTILVDGKEELDEEEEEETTEAAPADGLRTPLPLATSSSLTPVVSTVAPQGSGHPVFSSC